MYSTQYPTAEEQALGLKNLHNRSNRRTAKANRSNFQGEQRAVQDEGTELQDYNASIAPMKRNGSRVELSSSVPSKANGKDVNTIFIDSESDSVFAGEDEQSRERKMQMKARKWPKPNGKERPKVLLPCNRARALGHFLLLHAIPFGTALALIIINIKTRYYGVDGKWVGALQYVAKVHELLMQISLVTVIVALLQYLLVFENFVPFGAVFSAYQVSSLSYLWSSEFCAALTTSDFSGAVFFAFAFFVPFTILLAAAVGPSSAIAMQPRQVNFTRPSYQVAINVSSEELFPTSFETAGPALYFKSAQYNERSPAAGWQYLSNLPSVGADPGATLAFNYSNQLETGSVGSQGTLAGLQVEDGDGPIMPPIYSTPMTTSTTDIGETTGVVRTMYVQYAPNSTFATTQSVPVALAMRSVIENGWDSGIFNVPSIAQIEQLQPYASVYCQPNAIFGANDTRPFQFPTTYVAGCSPSGDYCPFSNSVSTIDYLGSNRGQIFSQWKPSPQGQVIWIRNITISSPQSTALGAIVVQPDMCDSQYLMTSACVIGAQWANTTSYIRDPTESKSSSSRGFTYGNEVFGVAISVLTPNDLAVMPDWSRPSIPLSVRWAKSLDQVTDVKNRTVSDNLLRLMFTTDNICPENGSYVSSDVERPYMHERLLATMVANGMAHASSSGQVCLYNTTSPGWECPNADGDGGSVFSEPPPGVLLTMKCSVPGYAWNLDGVPIKIALVILIIYCIYIGGFVIYTFVSGRSSMTWRNLSELTALAINSAPTGTLKNTSCGIGKLETFRNLVGLREGVENERGLELVFKRDEDEDGGRYVNAIVGKAY